MMRTFLSTTAGIAALLISGAALAGNNEVYIEQFDLDQTAAIDQSGDNNVADIYQAGEGHSFGLSGDPFKDDPHQNGSGNSIVSKQNGKNNSIGSTRVQQDGNNNNMLFDQFNEDNSIANALQRGNNNTMDYSQSGGSKNVIQTTAQVGNRNSMTIDQVGGENGRGWDAFGAAFETGVRDIGEGGKIGSVTLNRVSDSYASQNGDDNILTVSQNGDANGFTVSQGTWDYSSFGSEFDLRQTGLNNYTYGYQVGNAQFARINQDGTRNLAVVSQTDTVAQRLP